jgi:chemotaxis protein MotB
MSEPLLLLPESRASKGSDPQWMLTFADLMSLLLTFFVMLYAMHEMPNGNFDKLRASFASRWYSTLDESSFKIKKKKGVNAVTRTEALSTNYLYFVMDKKFAPYVKNNQIGIHKYEDRLVLTLKRDDMFEPGTAKITPEVSILLSSIGATISTLENQIEVYGYASSSNNWTLAMHRALAASRQLSDAGYTLPINAVGIGNARYDRVSAALPKELRKPSADRVDIIVHSRAIEE